MLRNDFVSNSSSSSFIVAAEDNKFDILLHNYDVLTLEEYIKHYFREDLFSFYTHDEFKIENFRFLSDAKFNAEFAHGLRNCLPNSCKDNMEAYITLSNNRPEGSWDSDVVRKWSENLDKLFEDIKTKVLKSLQLKWKNSKFHSEEVDDNWIYDDSDGRERDDGIETNEELVQERIDYINGLKPLKFFRTFSHH